MNVMHVLYSEAWGGLELYAIQYIQRLIQNDVPCTLYCKKNSRVYQEALSYAIPVCTKPPFLAVFEVRRFTHVHAHQRQDLLLVRLGLMGSPRISFIYTLYMMAPSKQDIYHRWIYSRIQAAMSSSELVCSDMRKNFPMNPDDVHLIRYGREENEIQIAEEKKQSIYKEWNHLPGRVVFGSLCRIDPGKGVQDIVQALFFLSLAELNQIELWFIGDPTLESTATDGTAVYEKKSKELYQQISKLEKDPKFQNVIKLIPFQKEYHAYLSCIDVFLLGSHGETYSIAVIDAMQMGLPVIGTNSGGTTEQIGNQERGMLVPPQKPQEIAQAIQYYLLHKEKICEQGESAKRWANKNHSWKSTIQKTIQLYQKDL